MVDGMYLLCPPRLALPCLGLLAAFAPLHGNQPILRLVSAPDLINADVEYQAPRCFDLDETASDYLDRLNVIKDARILGNQFSAGVKIDPNHPGDTNDDTVLSIQEGYRGGMQHMIESIAAESPDAFLVSGDLIDGEWATIGDWKTRPLAERLQHVEEQGDIYYDAYYQHFVDAGYTGPIYSVIGDHEIGDNNWWPSKVPLLPTFYAVYREKARLPETVSGGAYVDAPADLLGRVWAKKIENILLMGIETFDVKTNAEGDITAIDPDSLGKKLTTIPQVQLDWIEATLALADADVDIDHIIVMGHAPFNVPGVRVASSSNLRIGGGTESALWQLFEQYNVDLYLAGEVHAVSGYKKNGVTQIVTSGNQFSPATKTNYLVIDVFEDRLELVLKEAPKIIVGERLDAADAINDDNSKPTEWRIREGDTYNVVGTATLAKNNDYAYFSTQSGQLDSLILDEDGASPDPNLAPEIQSASANPSTVNDSTTQLSVSASDPEGGAVTYGWSLGSSPAGSAPSIGSGQNPTVTFDKAGDYIFIVTVTDPLQTKSTRSVNVTVNQTATGLQVRGE